MSRFAIVPQSWFSKLPVEAVPTLVRIATYADARTGQCWPSNAELAQALGRDERSVRRHINAAIKAGLISIVGFDGHKRTIRIECPDWRSITRRQIRVDRTDEPFVLTGHECPPSPDTDVHPDRTPVSSPDMSVHADRTPVSVLTGHECPPSPDTDVRAQYRTKPKNKTKEQSGSGEGLSEESEPDSPAATTTTTPAQNLEPFESGTPAPLPMVRNAVEPHRPRLVELQPTKFRPETRDRIMSVLGHDGEQFARKVTQEQADAGFTDWILAEAERNKTPARLAFHLLKTAWRPGWVDPRHEEDARLEEMAEMMRSLK